MALCSQPRWRPVMLLV